MGTILILVAGGDLLRRLFVPWRPSTSLGGVIDACAAGVGSLLLSGLFAGLSALAIGVVTWPLVLFWSTDKPPDMQAALDGPPRPRTIRDRIASFLVYYLFALPCLFAVAPGPVWRGAALCVAAGALWMHRFWIKFLALTALRPRAEIDWTAGSG